MQYDKGFYFYDEATGVYTIWSKPEMQYNEAKLSRGEIVLTSEIVAKTKDHCLALQVLKLIN